MNETNVRQLSKLQRQGMVVGLVGLVLSTVGALFDLERFWQSYLFGYLFWLEMGLGCLGVLLLHHLVGGNWSYLIQRLMEAGTFTLPLLALLFVPLLFGLDSLYIWTDPQLVAHSELLESKTLYLNVPFFLARTAVYFIIWLALAYLLNRWSAEQDQDGGQDSRTRLRRLSGVGLILYVVTVTFAAFDWMMSLEPEWFSSIYGVFLIVGSVLAALALAVIGLRLYSRHGPLPKGASNAHWANYFNDLGNFLLGFLMIWAYITFSQFLIIWSTNIPEEGIWYYHRTQGDWRWIGIMLVLGHFALPFFILLWRQVKRNSLLLTILALIILVMRLVDIYWLIMPAFHPDGVHFHWLDLMVPIAMGGAWLAIFTRQLAKRPFLPLNYPHIQEVFKRGQYEEGVTP